MSLVQPEDSFKKGENICLPSEVVLWLVRFTFRDENVVLEIFECMIRILYQADWVYVGLIYTFRP